MRRYSQLTSEQRYQISDLYKVKSTLTCITDIVGVHKSTISRELRHNVGKIDYPLKQAPNLTENRFKAQIARRLNQAHWDIIAIYIRQE